MIIDEVHNFVHMCLKEPSATRIYEHICMTSNLKICALSGTPCINNPYEMTKLFNMPWSIVVKQIATASGCTPSSRRTRRIKLTFLDDPVREKRGQGRYLGGDVDNYEYVPEKKAFRYDVEERAIREQATPVRVQAFGDGEYTRDDFLEHFVMDNQGIKGKQFFCPYDGARVVLRYAKGRTQKTRRTSTKSTRAPSSTCTLRTFSPS